MCARNLGYGSQITESTNIYETMTYLMKIPTAYLVYLTIVNSQGVYLGVFDHDRRLKMAAKTGNTYISETMKGIVKISTTNLRFKIM